MIAEESRKSSSFACGCLVAKHGGFFVFLIVVMDRERRTGCSGDGGERRVFELG